MMKTDEIDVIAPPGLLQASSHFHQERLGIQMLIYPQKAFEVDDPHKLLGFAIDVAQTKPCALATLVDIRGGAARPLGSHIVVAADGRYAGYVSGGCVEAAIATEALCAINDGRDKRVTFGKDSPFKDIVLPCGGSITVSIHLLKDVASLRQALTLLSERHPAAISYHPTQETLTQSDPTGGVGWKDDVFVTVYSPSIRTVVSGGSFEVARLVALLKAAEMETVTVVDRFQTSDLKQKIDGYTAIVLMHHDLDKEIDLLEVALSSDAFYIGALGSRRTHMQRRQRLLELGYANVQIDRIKAPIGVFGPARDTTTLAISVLADIAMARANALSTETGAYR